VDNFTRVEHDENGMEVTNGTLPNKSTLKNREI
jgi:hypothetical protein